MKRPGEVSTEGNQMCCASPGPARVLHGPTENNINESASMHDLISTARERGSCTRRVSTAPQEFWQQDNDLIRITHPAISLDQFLSSWFIRFSRCPGSSSRRLIVRCCASSSRGVVSMIRGSRTGLCPTSASTTTFFAPPGERPPSRFARCGDRRFQGQWNTARGGA
jgi:hypothetical protein